MDDSATLRTKAFNRQCDRIFPHVCIGEMIELSKFYVVVANKKYNQLKSDYEIVVQEHTEFNVMRDIEPIPIQPTFQLHSLGDMESLKVGDVYDVIGIIKSVSPSTIVYERVTHRPLSIVRLLLFDSTGNIEVNLWNEMILICNAFHKMGQKMSFNGDLIHSMKRMRLTNSSAVCTNHDDPLIFRILDITTPTSPTRKHYADEYNVFRNALNAPLEEEFITDNIDENVIEERMDYIQPLHSALAHISDAFNEKPTAFDDSYSNEELISFMLKQEEKAQSLDVINFGLRNDIREENVFELDAKLSMFDVNRIKKITDGIKYRYAGDHTYEQIITVIKLLSVPFSQSLVMQNEMSLPFIAYRQSLNPVILPFSCVCYVFQRSMGKSDAKQRSIKVHCINGSTVWGTIIAFRCNHLSSNTHRGVPLVVMYSNFVLHEDRHMYSHESLHCGPYVYIGGDVAIERAIINKFTAEFIHLTSSIHGLVNSLNQEAFNNAQSQLGNVDPHTLSSIFYRYLYIQTYISMGIKSVCAPANMGDYDLWAWKEFPRLLSCFTYLWMNHDQIVGPCNDQCSKCIVVDGHKKCRRRICGFKDVRIDTEEIKQIVIGCCRTPGSNSRYCDAHIDVVCENNMVEEKNVIAPKRSLRVKQQAVKGRKKGRKKKEIDKLNAIGCGTTKQRSDNYVTKCNRSFGLIALVYNCKIITCFSELYRSETLKEIINLFCGCIKGKLSYNKQQIIVVFSFYVLVSGRLSPTVVYDDGCHLVAYVRNHIGRDLTRTSALELLASTPISVDRLHFKNHVGIYCRLEMDPNKNRYNINTEAAEQCFAWLRNYGSIISSMNWLRAPVFMLILFHLKNLSYVQRKPSDIFPVYDIVQDVSNISLCHCAHAIIEENNINHEKNSNIDSNVDRMFKPLDLPASKTDWENIVRQLKDSLPKKCEIARTQTDYLGRQISNGEIRPSSYNISGLLNTKVPQTPDEACKFVKAAEYYRKFMPNFSQIAEPLRKFVTTTRTQQKKGQKQ
ncbi:unnamed protein product [Rotaria socialis]|uniref:Replication protein A OB domain-containing protein n=1 Tax=Rotaria socialis TaxID=392032 RepID=A0A818L8V0_9BILA|nr:unnamed protein product [Rotaria socialis]